jgi:tripartite-type tricarboxylate transporter receptor subunit TctC
MSRLSLKAAAAAAAAIFALFAPSAGFAQGAFKPDQPVKFVVPSPPGTTLDLLPRMIGQKLTERWKQPTIVINRPGAAGVLGADMVYKAEPDGFTLLTTAPGALVLTHILEKKPAYDPEAFVPVSILIRVPQILIVNPKVPVNNLAEWIAYAKANPGKMAYASPGTGSAAHLAQEELFHQLDVKLLHIPYQGMSPAITDIIANNVQTMFAAAGTVLPAIREGKLRAIAITGGDRLKPLPDVPVIRETVPAFDHVEWFGVVAPPKTPAPIVAELSKGIAEGMNQPEVRDKLTNLGFTVLANTPEEAAKFIAAERMRWKAVVDARRARGAQQKPELLRGLCHWLQDRNLVVTFVGELTVDTFDIPI